MVNFLFWNLNRKPLQRIIRNLADLYDVHIFIFAECDTGPAEMLLSLNLLGETRYFYHPGICEKIQVYTTLGQDAAPPLREADRFTIRRVYTPSANDILLASAHLPSKLHWNDNSQLAECMEFVREIREAEVQVDHARTVVVGDFNMNPFELGMISTIGFHAVMSKSVAQRRSRVVQSREYPFFYNPMWSFMGDISSGPPGTYYYDSAQHEVFFWNMFDQVLISPELLRGFRNEDVSIIDSDGEISFMSEKGRIAAHISDHLPILFRLNV